MHLHLVTSPAPSPLTAPTFGKRRRRGLPNNAVRHIRALYASGVSVKDIASASDIHVTTVYKIAQGAMYATIG